MTYLVMVMISDSVMVVLASTIILQLSIYEKLHGKKYEHLQTIIHKLRTKRKRPIGLIKSYKKLYELTVKYTSLCQLTMFL